VKSDKDIFDSRTGWVYCLVHPQYPNLIKIGYTERSVNQRIAELERGTGTLPGYVCVFAVNCFEPYLLEQGIHKRLARYRVWAEKEFFQIELGTAERAVQTEINRLDINVLQVYHVPDSPTSNTRSDDETPRWLNDFDRLAAEKDIETENRQLRRPGPYRQSAVGEFFFNLAKYFAIVVVFWLLIYLIG